MYKIKHVQKSYQYYIDFFARIAKRFIALCDEGIKKYF